MITPREIQELPWPSRKQPHRLKPPGGQYVPPLEEKERLREENRIIREGNIQRHQVALREKRAATPRFSITITSADAVVLEGKLKISLGIQYDGMPNGEPLPVVLKIENTSLSSTHLFPNFYQIFSDAVCTKQSQVASSTTSVTVRRARDDDGRFLPVTELPISANQGWIEMRPGDTNNRDVTLNIAANSGWKRSLQVGKDYWLRYGLADPEAASEHLFQSWRFGTLEEWSGKPNPGIHDARSTWVGIGFGVSNSLPFRVHSVEGTVYRPPGLRG